MMSQRSHEDFFARKFSLWILCGFSALFAISFFFTSKKPFAQSDSSLFDFNGYIKNLQTFSVSQEADSVYLSNLVHNRIHFSIHRGKHFLFHAGARNL
jgi:hypothetical protein